MQSVHVKSLDKYHPGYKDRTLLWCKVYFKMLNADPEFEMVDEIDKWRYIAFIILELQSKEPTPINPQYLARKGFNLKKRPISLTLQMLHNFLVSVNAPNETCAIDKNRIEESRVEKKREEKYTPEFEEFWKRFKGRWNPDKGDSGSYVKVGKFAAFEEWRKLSIPEQETAAAVADKVRGEYTPDAERWLKRRLFDDFR